MHVQAGLLSIFKSRICIVKSTRGGCLQNRNPIQPCLLKSPGIAAALVSIIGAGRASQFVYDTLKRLRRGHPASRLSLVWGFNCHSLDLRMVSGWTGYFRSSFQVEFEKGCVSSQ